MTADEAVCIGERRHHQPDAGDDKSTGQLKPREWHYDAAAISGGADHGTAIGRALTGVVP